VISNPYQSTLPSTTTSGRASIHPVAVALANVATTRHAANATPRTLAIATTTAPAPPSGAPSWTKRPSPTSSTTRCHCDSSTR